MEVALRYYSNQGTAKALGIYNFPEDYKTRPKIRLSSLRYLFAHRNVYKGNCPSPEQLKIRTQDMLDEIKTSRDQESLREIVDIYTQYIPEESATVLEYLRQIDTGPIDTPAPMNTVDNIIAIDIMPSPTRDIRTVYGDNQNVHNSEINKTVVKAATNLYMMYKEMLEIESDDYKIQQYKAEILHDIMKNLKSRYSHHKEDIEELHIYILDSSAVFGDRILSLQDIFLALCLWINDSPAKLDLEVRLFDEIKEMKGQCSTGHLARFVNVIQGFTDDPELCIRISSKDQCISMVRTYLNRRLSECKDEKVVDGMLSGDLAYIKFLRKCVSEKILEWEKEYGKDILEFLPGVVNKFAGVKVFAEKSLV
jgi:hypothetical protein